MKFWYITLALLTIYRIDKLTIKLEIGDISVIWMTYIFRPRSNKFGKFYVIIKIFCMRGCIFFNNRILSDLTFVR